MARTNCDQRLEILRQKQAKKKLLEDLVKNVSGLLELAA